jgi:glycosyltransferase involved in cell wall biosynthesis
MYNAGLYIEQCIHSVLNQSYQNFEIVCIDDGCNDDTLPKLEAINDDRIRLIRQQNRGLSAARNTGINASHGLYIALLDADDYWGVEKLALHYQHLMRNPEIGVSYCASAFIDQDSQLLGIVQQPKLEGISSKDIFCRNPIGNGSAAVIRKAVFNQIAYCADFDNQQRISYFDESMRQSEDIECWLRISLDTSWRFGGIADALTFYRLNAGGLSANLNKQFDAWQFAVKKNRVNHPDFFQRWYSLAESYQKRYLSRRATQTGNASDAIRLINQALLGNFRIAIEEPRTTFISTVCAYLCLLPNRLYSPLQTFAMQWPKKLLKRA